MKFYVLQDDYVKYLQAIDHRVPDNERGDRTYVGVVFEIGDFKYFAPLTSPKPHHANITGSDLRFFKVYEHTNPSNGLGMLRLCNMVPLAEGTYRILDLEAQDQNYKRLLRNQIHFILRRQTDIKERAALVYELVLAAKTKELVESSCDFIALEKACVAYAQANPVPEQPAHQIKPQRPAKAVEIKPRSKLTLKREPAKSVDANPSEPGAETD